MGKRFLLFSVMAFVTLLILLPAGNVRAETNVVTINATGIDSGISGIVINFNGNNVLANQLPRTFNVANGTNAAYTWQEYINVNSSLRYAFINATKTVLTTTCFPAIPPALPICLTLPFTSPMNVSGTVQVTTNMTLAANYKAQYSVQFSAQSGGVINEKYPGGAEAQKKVLEGEGHTVAA